MRGQIIIGSENSEDLGAVNRILNALPQNADASLAEKKDAMHRYVEKSIEGKTFGISYVGKMDWCGPDRYVMDLHAYIGEKHTKNMLLIEVMTVGEDFTLNVMQSGKGRPTWTPLRNSFAVWTSPFLWWGRGAICFATRCFRADRAQNRKKIKNRFSKGMCLAGRFFFVCIDQGF